MNVILLMILLTLAVQFCVPVEMKQNELERKRRRYKIWKIIRRFKRKANPDPDPTIHKSSVEDLPVHIHQIRRPKFHLSPVLPGAMGLAFRQPRPFIRQKTRPVIITTVKTSTAKPQLYTTVASFDFLMGRAFMGRSMDDSTLSTENETLSSSTDEPINSTLSAEEELNGKINLQGDAIPNDPFDTPAKHGDPCNPTNAIIPDYCERAEYPHKGRMICIDNKCDCKFGRQKNGTSTEYKQLKWNGKICQSPEGGVCYVKFPANNTMDADGNQAYIINITAAHEQCSDGLKCAQAHPRRFSSFNQYNYYCLTEENTAPDEEHGSHGIGSSNQHQEIIMSVVVVFTFVYPRLIS